MTKTKRLRGECQHCGGSLQFPAESIGLMAQCPRCAEETELMLAMPPQEPLIPRKVMVWTVITVALLVAGFVYFLAQLNYYEQRAVERRKKSASPVPAVTNAPASATPAPAKTSQNPAARPSITGPASSPTARGLDWQFRASQMRLNFPGSGNHPLACASCNPRL